MEYVGPGIWGNLPEDEAIRIVRRYTKLEIEIKMKTSDIILYQINLGISMNIKFPLGRTKYGRIFSI